LQRARPVDGGRPGGHHPAHIRESSFGCRFQTTSPAPFPAGRSLPSDPAQPGCSTPPTNLEAAIRTPWSSGGGAVAPKQRVYKLGHHRLHVGVCTWVPVAAPCSPASGSWQARGGDGGFLIGPPWPSGSTWGAPPAGPTAASVATQVLERTLVLMGQPGLPERTDRMGGGCKSDPTIKSLTSPNDHHETPARGLWWSHSDWMLHRTSQPFARSSASTGDLQREPLLRWLDAGS